MRGRVGVGGYGWDGMGWVVIGLVRYIAKRFEGIWRRGESDEPIAGNPTQPPHMYVS